MNKSLKITLIISAVIVVIIVISQVTRDGKDYHEVETELVELRNIVEKVSASGKIQPEIEVKITSEVSGQIINLPVKEGDWVKKGDLLVQINPDIYTSALNRAGAALNSARSNLANAKARELQVKAKFVAAEQSFLRSKKLHEQAVISESEWEQALSTYEVAKAEVEAGAQSVKAAEFAVSSAIATKTEAFDNLSRTTILAPQPGIVTALTKEEGESVLGNQMTAGEVIMKISDLNNMEVNVEVNESDIVRVSVGDTALVEVDAYHKDEFRGIVTEIGNTALNSMGGLSMDQVTNFSVKIRIIKSSYRHLMADQDSTFAPFRPGMSATVDIETATERGVLSIPIKAVTTRMDTATLTRAERRKLKKEREEMDQEPEDYVVVFTYSEDGKSKINVVETGIQDNKYIHITTGLKEGDEVISGPYSVVSRKLKNDLQVTLKTTKSKKDEEK